jgi:uncharacterized membrane protein
MPSRCILPTLIVLTTLWVCFAAYVLLTAPQLPERVATHFGTDGAANGWMTRAGHVQFTLAMGTALPAFILAIFAFIRHSAGWGLNIPHKDYWLAPERKEQTFAFIRRQGIWFAAILIGFFTAIHHAILAANTHTPPALSLADVGWFGSAYLVAMIAWIAIFLGRFFRKPS